MDKIIYRLEIKQNDEMGLFIDILDNNYNFITHTIYNEENDINKIIDIVKNNLGEN